ncbi:hypothetical protein GCM10011494_34860 [Novosphingobium endophyticum]|uniref:DUF1214 domain-containing protein n=1 Tax=Novosphingobium endophyticum TaxID=1955250 RepID=A0A916TVF3_9SPHN|nr:DUF1214 domain-containing protein [Novosphingobium endophyticum]GGC13022.1 hypothetical protein GCM10011494_34860 [Novosphingobium endophyticum]
MSQRRVWSVGLAALSLAAVSMSARAQEKPAQPPAPVPGWNEIVESLRTLPERMLAKLPEPMRSDPQVQQEVGRLALEALASQSLSAIGADGDFPQFLPSIGQVLNVGQPNADTLYRSAAITPGGTYRIRGLRRTLNHAVIAQGIRGGGQLRPQIFLSDLKADTDGRFELLLSPTRPAGYDGDWWQLDPGAHMLLLRMVSSKWGQEQSPTLAIERVDRPMGRPRPTATVLEQRLRALPKAIDTLALMFVDHHEQLRSEGFINKFTDFNVGAGSLQGQFYYEAAYELAEDEALIVESPVPMKCQYRSLILTNEIYETTDWFNNHSSLNIDQAAPDADGKLRIVVAHRDPGVKNWLDTAGCSATNWMRFARQSG